MSRHREDVRWPWQPPPDKPPEGSGCGATLLCACAALAGLSTLVAQGVWG